MRKTAVVLAVAIAGAAFGQMKPAQPNPVQITPGAGMQQMGEASLESAKRIERDVAIKKVKEGKAVWIDVRGKESYDASHIKGALSFPLSDIITRAKDLPRDKELITYCA